VGRIFVNVRDRQPQGIIDASELDPLCVQIGGKLRLIGDGDGRSMDTRVFTPKELYRECNNVPPDLTVYLGNLDYRAIGTLGHASIHVTENDTGSDDANHDANGLFLGHVPGSCGPSPTSMRLIDCGPAMLELLCPDLANATHEPYSTSGVTPQSDL
jgi:predicted AlkP superfamily phosphohydrolase/phosphomutase